MNHANVKFSLPFGWKEKLLDEVAERFSGHTPDKNVSEFWNGNIPWVSLKDTQRLDSLYIKETEDYTTREGIAHSSAIILPQGTVVISRDATIGKVGIMNEPMATSQHFINYVCTKDLDKFFLYYFLLSQRKNFERVANGSTIKTIGLKYFEKLNITLPPIDEQRYIVDVLLTWDRALELKEKLLEQKRLQKKGLMERLLTGKVRLPGFSGEWEKIKLSTIFDRVTRRNAGGNSNVLTISAKKGLVSQSDYFNRSVASETLDNYILLQKGEFAYNKSYSNGYPMGAIKRLNDYSEGVVTTLYICFKLKDNAHDSNFFEHYFAAGLLNKALMKITQEGARVHGLLNIAVSDFFAITICIPQNLEQEAIAEILSQSDKVIRNLEQEVIQIRQHKKGLMQLLLTGKVRVPAKGEMLSCQKQKNITN